MKMNLLLVTLLLLSPTAGTAIAADPSAGGRMVTNDDLFRIELDQDRSTLTQMPQVPQENEIEGSAPGGMIEEQETTPGDISKEQAPEADEPLKPEGDEGKGETRWAPGGDGY